MSDVKYGRARKFVTQHCQNCGDLYAIRSDLVAKQVLCRDCSRQAKAARRTIDLVGQRFGNWIVISRVTNKTWLCQCTVCGVERVVSGCALRQGLSTQCAKCGYKSMAETKTTHGMSHSSTWRSWRAAKERCTNPNNASYSRYGGAGITMCSRWFDSFENFLADMGPRPVGTSIDRYPNRSGNYEPSNTRWATPPQQSQNINTTKLTKEDVLLIWGSQMTPEQVVKQFHVTLKHATKVCSGKAWVDVWDEFNRGEQ